MHKSNIEITRQLEEQNSMQQESVSQISKKVSNLFFKLQCDQMDTKGSTLTIIFIYDFIEDCSDSSAWSRI